MFCGWGILQNEAEQTKTELKFHLKMRIYKASYSWLDNNKNTTTMIRKKPHCEQLRE